MTKRELRLVKKPTLVRNLADALTGKGWNRGIDGKISSRGYDISGAMHESAKLGVTASRDCYVADKTYGHLVDAVVDYAQGGEGKTVVYVGDGLRINADRLAGDAWVRANWDKISEGYEGLRLVPREENWNCNLYEVREAA